MKIKLYIIIIILIFSFNAFAKLKIEIRNIKNEWILEEPIMIIIHLKNDSKEVLRTYRSLLDFSSNSSLKLYISPMEGVEKIDGKVIEEPINQIFEYEGLWEFSKSIGLFNYIIKKAGSYNIKIVYDASIEANNYLNEGVYLGPSESNEIIINVKQPDGIDKEAYEYFEGCPLCNKDELLIKYPTSTYAGWALFTYQPDLPGPVVKNESAKKALLAIINGDSLEIKKWWKIDIKNISNEREQKIAQKMKMLMSNLELFANAHPDFMFSGYLLARSGFNALVLSEYKRACFMLDKSLKMPWGLAEFDKQRLKVHRDGTEWALGFLKENGLCK